MFILWILLQLFLEKAKESDYVTFGVPMARQFISKNKDPIELFSIWFSDARKSEIINPEAMALATSDPDGRPSVRMVLLKSFGEDGFVFYTNSNSKKGKQLSKTPYASLCFYWKSLLRQVRVEGIISKVNDSDADIYFASRSRDSQVGAWASKQSSKLSEQSDLDKRILKFTQKYEGVEVPRPDFWEGYSVLPEKIEFWLQQDSRLHERIEYTKIEKGWAHQRLYP